MKTLEEMIGVMQAAKDGKTIEGSPIGKNDWRELESSTIAWDWRDSDYRVKSEPRRIWVMEAHGDIQGTHYFNKTNAEYVARTSNFKLIEFVEVTSPE